jgi:hypothetical protein
MLWIEWECWIVKTIYHKSNINLMVINKKLKRNKSTQVLGRLHWMKNDEKLSIFNADLPLAIQVNNAKISSSDIFCPTAIHKINLNLKCWLRFIAIISMNIVVIKKDNHCLKGIESRNNFYLTCVCCPWCCFDMISVHIKMFWRLNWRIRLELVWWTSTTQHTHCPY